MMGNVTAAIEVDALFKQHAAEAGVSHPGACFSGVSPVRIEASFGSDSRVPDAFGRGGITQTGTLTTETGLSSHPLVTRMAVYPAGGGSAGEVALENEIGIQGGIGTLADTAPGVVQGVQAVANVLSMFGGSGRSGQQHLLHAQCRSRRLCGGNQGAERRRCEGAGGRSFLSTVWLLR